MTNGPSLDVELGRRASGKAYEFGANWRSFLGVLNDERIAHAESSLREMLGMQNLNGKTFLDIGCGSGLFSLAAVRLGAVRVHSLDYDIQSVGCALELKRRYFPQLSSWTVERGSALDGDYLKGLGRWDVVYSWGVLHHTGRMWTAFQNIVPLVAPGGLLFISIYNDQGRTTAVWTHVKRLYNRGVIGKALVSSLFVPYWAGRGLVADFVRFRNPLSRYRDYASSRGMSVWHDWHDWLGGYPFEVAKPEQVFDFFASHDFSLSKLTTCGGGLGCNEFVFIRAAA